MKTIPVSEEFDEWVEHHGRDEESMEATLRRLVRGPQPGDVAGFLSADEAEIAAETVDSLRRRDGDRLDAAREAMDGSRGSRDECERRDGNE